MTPSRVSLPEVSKKLPRVPSPAGLWGRWGFFLCFDLIRVYEGSRHVDT